MVVESDEFIYMVEGILFNFEIDDNVFFFIICLKNVLFLI